VGEKSGIDYVDSSWGPWRGCTKVSQGCAHCYAERNMNRFPRTRAEWAAANRPDGVPTRASHATFFAPRNAKRWPSGSKVFVCPWSDFFHLCVPEYWLDEAMSVIDRRHDLIWIVPTKRPQHVLPALRAAHRLTARRENVWLLLSVENQATADERLQWVQALRPYFGLVGISAEPLLGPIDIHLDIGRFDWLVVGAESGPGARWGKWQCSLTCAKLGRCHLDDVRDDTPPPGWCEDAQWPVLPWASELARQAHEAAVLVYHKQYPARGIGGRLCTDPRRFPPDLRDRCSPDGYEGT